MKEIISARVTIKDIEGTTLCQTTEYGVKLDERTIKIGDRFFRAGRKAGFGKSAYICERANGEFHKVIIDKIEKVA